MLTILVVCLPRCWTNEAFKFGSFVLGREGDNELLLLLLLLLVYTCMYVFGDWDSVNG